MLLLECKARGQDKITALQKLRNFISPSQPLNNKSKYNNMSDFKTKQLKAKRAYLINEVIESVSFVGVIGIMFYLLIF